MRSVRDLLAIAVLALDLHPAAGQPVLAPDPSAAAKKPLDLTRFADEHGTAFPALRGATGRDGRAWIVSPIYTRCRSTCSPLTAALKRVLGQGSLDPGTYRVLSFSFDPEERAETLAAFRARMDLPADWLTLRATDRVALDAALAGLDFRTIALGDGQLDHPNLVAVLTADMRLSEYLFGLDFTAGQLAAAVDRARSGGAGRRAWRPALFVVAALGFAASAFVFVSRLLRLRARTVRLSARPPSDPCRAPPSGGRPGRRSSTRT